MIKIHDKIWYVVKPKDTENLAYMSPYAEDKEGNPLSNIQKMQTTGRQWAGIRDVKYKLKENGDYEKDEHGRLILDSNEYIQGEEAVVDNIPTKGFYIGSSVSRWSTSNKLFRVKDPRGFTVEVPTDNIATLLHHTTVTNGVVQEECVWGREGTNHILLPVNSEPYLKTLGQMDTLANKLIPLSDLKVGDWVKFFEDKNEYYYAGKVKATWAIRGHYYETSWGFSSYGARRDEKWSEWVEVEDDKWVHLFLFKYTDTSNKYSAETPSKPKIVEVLRNALLELTAEDISWYCPQRVYNKVDNIGGRGWRDYERKLIKVEMK